MYKIKQKSDRARCWFGRIENTYLSCGSQRDIPDRGEFFQTGEHRAAAQEVRGPHFRDQVFCFRIDAGAVDEPCPNARGSGTRAHILRLPRKCAHHHILPDKQLHGPLMDALAVCDPRHQHRDDEGNTHPPTPEFTHFSRRNNKAADALFVKKKNSRRGGEGGERSLTPPDSISFAMLLVGDLRA
jgi:hypothetical protein